MALRILAVASEDTKEGPLVLIVDSLPVDLLSQARLAGDRRTPAMLRKLCMLSSTCFGIRRHRKLVIAEAYDRQQTYHLLTQKGWETVWQQSTVVGEILNQSHASLQDLSKLSVTPISGPALPGQASPQPPEVAKPFLPSASPGHIVA